MNYAQINQISQSSLTRPSPFQDGLSYSLQDFTQSSFLHPRYKEAYADIIQNFPRLAGLDFTGEHRFRYAEALLSKLNDDLPRLYRESSSPIEIRFDPKEPSKKGRYSFKNNLWVRSSSELENYLNYMQVNTDFYEKLLGEK